MLSNLAVLLHKMASYLEHDNGTAIRPLQISDKWQKLIKVQSYSFLIWTNGAPNLHLRILNKPTADKIKFLMNLQMNLCL